MAEPREHYDVVLVQPGIIWVYDAFEHLGLGYLAAALRAAGLRVKIVDAILDRLRMSDLAAELDRYDISVLGVTLVSHGYEATVRFLEHYRARHPSTRVVAGGHFATFAAARIFEHTDVFSGIVLGEGEQSFVRYCQEVLAGREPRVPDVALPGEPVERSRTRIADMDALPFPARDYLPLALRRGAIASITASRGCYARCSFCTVPSFYQAKNGPRWMSRSIESVIEELRELHGRYGLDHFMFVDDNFMGPGRSGRQRALEFAEAYGRSGLPMTFHIDLRAMDVYEDVIAALTRVGLKSVFIGIESVSDDDLLTYRKDLRAESNWDAVRIIKAYGLERTLSMIMFNPSTTPESIARNCRFLRHADYFPRNPISILNIYEGTEHRRTFADRIHGPFWDYRFSFERPEVERIYREALDFCRDTLPLERELSRRPGGATTERHEVYVLRLGFLEDAAVSAGREPLAGVRRRWDRRLDDLRSRVRATSPREAASSRRERLFARRPNPDEDPVALEAGAGIGAAGGVEVGADTPTRPG